VTSTRNPIYEQWLAAPNHIAHFCSQLPVELSRWALFLWTLLIPIDANAMIYQKRRLDSLDPLSFLSNDNQATAIFFRRNSYDRILWVAGMQQAVLGKVNGSPVSNQFKTFVTIYVSHSNFEFMTDDRNDSRFDKLMATSFSTGSLSLMLPSTVIIVPACRS
jgi:hypothetical protein